MSEKLESRLRETLDRPPLESSDIDRAIEAGLAMHRARRRRRTAALALLIAMLGAAMILVMPNRATTPNPRAHGRMAQRIETPVFSASQPDVERARGWRIIAVKGAIEP